MTASGYWQRQNTSRRRFLAGVAAGAAGIPFLTACGDDDSADSGDGTTPTAEPTATINVPKTETATARKGGTLNMIWNVADAQLDPHTTTEHLGPELWRAASHGLLKQEAGTQAPVADLATRWENPDATTYVFRLDPRAKWQNTSPVNGRAVTAEDVVYSMKRISTPDASHPRASGFTIVDSWTATDETTVTMKLKSPFVPILTPVSDKWSVIVPREVVEKYGDLKRGDAVIGCGPFICQSADSSKGATLVRNPDYWNSPYPYMDKVVYTTILDAQAQLAAFISKQADVSLTIPDLQIDQVKASDVEIYSYPGTDLAISVIGGPNNKAPFTDERVRRAVNLVIDRDAIAQAAFPGARYTQAGVFSNKAWGLPTEEVQKLPGYGKKTEQNIKDARDLVAAAGMAGTEIVLNTSPQYPQYHIDRATAIQPMLEKIGFKVKLNSLEFAAFKDAEAKRTFQMTAASYAAYGDPHTPLVNSFTTTGTRNYWSFSDPEYDALAQKQAVEMDPKARLQLIHEMQRRLLTGTPVAHNTFYINTTLAVRKRVRNFVGTNMANSSTTGWFLAGMWLDS